MLSEEEKNFLENIKNILSDLEDTEDGAIISLNQEEIDSLKSIPKIIEKQQKEIEEYKKIVECIEEFKRLKRPVMELVHEMNKFEDEFVSKDKIKEKIKEKQDVINKLHPASDIVIIDDLENEINCYKELLEENK